DEPDDSPVLADLGDIRRFYETRLAIEVGDLALVRDRFSSEGARDIRTDFLIRAGSDDVLNAAPSQLLLRTAKPLFVGGAHESVPNVPIDVGETDRHRIGDERELPLATAESLLSFPTLGDVAGGATRVDELTVLEIAARADHHLLRGSILRANDGL